MNLQEIRKRNASRAIREVVLNFVNERNLSQARSRLENGFEYLFKCQSMYRLNEDMTKLLIRDIQDTPDFNKTFSKEEQRNLRFEIKIEEINNENETKCFVSISLMVIEYGLDNETQTNGFKTVFDDEIENSTHKNFNKKEDEDIGNESFKLGFNSKTPNPLGNLYYSF